MRKVLLLIGSPKGMKSVSASLGSYLLDQLAEKGWQTERLWLRADWKNPAALTDAVDAADLLLLSAPLYFDGAPGPVVRAMEIIAVHRKAIAGAPATPLVAIVQSGFPEPHQSETALAIYRRFALAAGFTWAGGLKMGAGAALPSGVTLAEAGNLFQPTRQALSMAAEALDRQEPVGQEALDLFARQLIPRWIYLTVGQLGWIRDARRNKLWPWDLFRRPYARR